ncbi:MAG TPA: Ig-like domain repeat protein, partial [Candidatus Angelobacter sp.]
VSKTGDPVSGGYNFYSVHVDGGFGDYPKFGVWPDGIYISANVFDFAATGGFQNVRMWALNKGQMYAGAPAAQAVSFDAPATEFTLLPSNARLQAGTPPPGTPDLFSVVAQYTNVVSVYKFHVDFSDTSASTFSGPFTSQTGTAWSQLTNFDLPSPGNSLDSLFPRLMMQNQYSNIGGIESLWNSHTVGASGSSSAQAGVRYYQVRVTGGAVEANATQAFTFSPDTTIHRFMPSVAVDRVGDMAIGYSATSATLNPAIRYAGRLAGDPVNSITQTETSLIQGAGTQTGNCGSAACNRWGDYSAMTLDPDGCTFWYTNMYYPVSGLDYHTRIGSFSFPGCVAVGTGGAVAGTVTAQGSGTPIQGATVSLGSRTTTTDVNGAYSFTGIPAGTYPALTASSPGLVSVTVSTIVVNDNATTTENFSLAAAPTNGCFTDATQAAFLAGVASNCDLASNPGHVILASPSTIDQQNTSVGNGGFFFSSTTWQGQTFTPSVSGKLLRADLLLNCITAQQTFCLGSGPNPDITVSIRATTGNPAVPIGPDLATAAIPGFDSPNGAVFLTANFSNPASLAAGTTYAIIFRSVSNLSGGNNYSDVCSCAPDTNPYSGGQLVSSADSGSTWVADSTAGGRDIGFKLFMSFDPAVDQQNTNVGSGGFFFNTTTWEGQTFTPSFTGKLSRADLLLNCVSCTASGPNPDITVSIRATTGTPAVPTGPDLATATIPGFTSPGFAQFFSANFSNPPLLNAGQTYAVIFRSVANFSSGNYSDVCSCNPDTNPYVGGQLVTSTDGGSTWFADGTAGGRDIGFKIFMDGAFASPGTFTSSLKDANPSPGSKSAWGTISWTANTPAKTNIQFQVAASNNSAGPFNFVGPDGTPSTFFINGGSLAQFNGFRFLKYQATLTTSDPTVTPSLDSVNICFNDVQAPSIHKSFSPASIPLNGITTLTFTISNPNAATDLTGVAFSDVLARGRLGMLVVANPANVNNSCGGTATAPVGGQLIQLSGGNVTHQASCTLSVDLTGNQAGDVPNTTSSITSNEGGAGATSNTVNLTIVGPPALSMAFNPATIALNASSALTFTITNPSANTTSLTGVAFTDTLPSGLTMAGSTATTCGGTLTTTAPSSISLSGATVLTGSSCSFSVNITGLTTGNKVNTTSSITSTNGGAGQSATASLEVKADTTTALTASPNPSVFGQSVIFTATVTPVSPGTGTPGGTVNFLDGGSSIGTGTLNNGVATFATSNLAVASHTITASYGGDANFLGSTGSLPGNPQVVNKANTATALTSSLNPSVFGQSVTLTATVSVVAPGTGTPTGRVDFGENGTLIGRGTLSNGVATVSTSALAAGKHSITAVYVGDGNFQGSSNFRTGFSQVVNQANTTMLVTSSTNPTVAGQTINFTATVSPVAPGAGTPTGTVTFLDGGSSIGTGTLNGGVATFANANLAVGSHTITASYVGDGNFIGSISSLTGNPQVVNNAKTTMLVTSSANPSVTGQTITFTATVSPVSPGAGSPGGTVTFLDGGSSVGMGTLSSGVATFAASNLALGSHTITASYGGDTNFIGGTGSLTGNPQVISKANTTTAVTSSANPGVIRQSITFTATVSAVAPGAGTPGGTVTFLDGSSTLGTGTLSGGAATLQTSSLAAGSHSITSKYGSDANFLASTSNPLSLTINAPTANLSSASLSFSQTGVGSTNAAAPVTVTNGGN